MKRTIAGFLAVLVLWLSVTTPARALVFVPAIGVAMTSGGTASLAVSSASVASLVGVSALALMLTGDTRETRIPLTDKPQVSEVMPAPAAPASAAPVVPAQTGVRWCANFWPNGGGASTGYFCGGYFATQGESITSMCQAAGAQSGNMSWSTVYCYSGPNASGDMVGTMGPVVTESGSSPAQCGAGYGPNSDQCLLVNARQAAPDNKCDLKFTGTGAGSKYMYYDDADCPNGPTIDHKQSVPGLRRDGETVFVSGKDGYGRPILIEVLAQPDGSKVYVRHYLQSTEGGNSVVQTTQLEVDRTTGTVTKASVSTNPGTINQPATDTVPTTTTTTATSTDTPTPEKDETKQAQTQETCGLPDKPECAIDDSGLAGRGAEISTRTTQAKSELDNEQAKLDPNGLALPTLTRDWLPSLLPGSAVSCKPIPLPVAINHGPLAGLSISENLDLCPYFDIARQVFGYFFMMGAVFYIWRSVLYAGAPTSGIFMGQKL